MDNLHSQLEIKGKMRTSYLPREAQEACLDCAAEHADASAPAASADTSSIPLNSLICSDRTTRQKIQNQLVMAKKMFSFS